MAARDRLADLRDGAEFGAEDLEKAGAGGAAPDNSDQFMADFFEQVNETKRLMAETRRNVDEIEENFGAYINAVTAAQAKETGAELDRLISETNDLKSQTKGKLDAMKAANAKASEAAGPGGGGTEGRMRENMQTTLAKKFVDLMRHYEQVQTDYKNKQREKVERQIRTVNPNATLEEIDEVIKSGKADKVFSQQLLADTRYQREAEEALDYVEAKHREIQKLEASIEELHQLFIDMAILVEEQGELFDQIEYNVNQAKAYTEKGVVQLQKAVKTQRKNRKKMCIMLIFLTLLVVGVCVPVILTLVPSGDGGGGDDAAAAGDGGEATSAPAMAAAVMAQVAKAASSGL